MGEIIDLSERVPFRPLDSTRFALEHLRQVADEIERGEYGQIDVCLVALRNEKHTHLSRMSLADVNMEIWKALANSIYNAVVKRMFQ